MRAGPLAAATEFAGAGRFAIIVIALTAIIGVHPPTLNAGLADASRTVYAAGCIGISLNWFEI
jgi:hypothetical protein